MNNRRNVKVIEMYLELSDLIYAFSMFFSLVANIVKTNACLRIFNEHNWFFRLYF